jgi:DNA replication protein DnaC
MAGERCVDEVGYLAFDIRSADLLFEVVTRRYEEGSILLTSNRDITEWPSLFGDPLMASAAMDRLLHHANVVTLDGQSYRNPSRTGAQA